MRPALSPTQVKKFEEVVSFLYVLDIPYEDVTIVAALKPHNQTESLQHDTGQWNNGTGQWNNGTNHWNNGTDQWKIGTGHWLNTTGHWKNGTEDAVKLVDNSLHLSKGPHWTYRGRVEHIHSNSSDILHQTHSAEVKPFKFAKTSRRKWFVDASASVRSITTGVEEEDAEAGGSEEEEGSEWQSDRDDAFLTTGKIQYVRAYPCRSSMCNAENVSD